VPKLADDWRLRLAFIAGLLLSPLILKAVAGFNGIGAPTVAFAILIPAGFLIGAGSALGNGCTSGHGICDARLSPRSESRRPLPFVARGERDKMFAAAKEETAGRLVSYGTTTSGIMAYQETFVQRIGKASVDSLLSFSMISAGVFFGAPTPHQPLAS
jgi:hypothetical protein